METALRLVYRVTVLILMGLGVVVVVGVALS